MRSPLVPLFLILLTTACGPGFDDLGELSSELSERSTCEELVLVRGGIGSGQRGATLSQRTLSGTEDVWEEYVEFDPGSRAICSFRVSGGADLSGLSLRVNYRGPNRKTMSWNFDVLDVETDRWVPVADNGFAKSWVWTRATLPLPGEPSRFVKNGRVQVRYGTGSYRDSSLLDEWVLLVDRAASSAPVDAGRPATDAGTEVGVPDAGTGGNGHGIWRPAPGTTWHIQYTGTLDTSVDATMYDVDLFGTPEPTIAALKAQGRKVICYFSAGSHEDWRADAAQFPSAAVGNDLDGWPGERWLDTRNATVREIMKRRLDVAVQKGCDGVDPDNMDGYTNDPGFPLTASTQVDYNRFIAREAHQRGLSVGLKNALDLIPQLVSDYDFAVNEECHRYDECSTLRPFTQAGKAVFHVEYEPASRLNSICAVTRPLGLSTQLKKLELDAWFLPCL
ncbi:MAG: endo alpha-1,4 polygalactosaminidase [Myxococcaceae bacterium]